MKNVVCFKNTFFDNPVKKSIHHESLYRLNLDQNLDENSLVSCGTGIHKTITSPSKRKFANLRNICFHIQNPSSTATNHKPHYFLAKSVNTFVYWEPPPL